MFNPDGDPARTRLAGVTIAPEKDIFTWYFLNSGAQQRACGFEKRNGLLELVDKSKFEKLGVEKQQWIREAWKAQRASKPA